MGDRLTPEVQDSIIKGLQDCFEISYDLTKAILISQNWNIEKCFTIFEAVSPRVKSDSNNMSTSRSRQSNRKKDPELRRMETNRVSESKNDGTSSKKKNSKNSMIDSASGASKLRECQRTGGEQKNKNVRFDNTVKWPTDNDGWSLVNLPNKQANRMKNKSKSPSPLNDGAEQSRSVEESKKKRRAELKAAYEKIKRKRTAVERVNGCIRCGVKVIVLMRGCPGSGKSTFADQILREAGIADTQQHIFSTDNYFIDSKGDYVFNPNNLDKAHTWNQELVEKVMKLGLSPVVVDNTHVRAWEMMCYAQFAVRLGYVLETVEPPTPWFLDESALARKNTHGVPKHKILLMKHNYDRNLTGLALLKKFQIEYNLQQTPPQPVIFSREVVVKIVNKAMVGRKIPEIAPPKRNIEGDHSNKASDKPNSSDIGPIENQLFNPIPLERSFFDHPVDPNVGRTTNPFHSDFITNTSSPAAFGKVNDSLSHSSYKFFNNDLADEKCLKESVSNALPSTSNFTSNLAMDMIRTDSDEFPSLSSGSPSNILKCEGDSNKNEIYYDKVKKLTELFPHLDKEFISDLCQDKNKDLDSLVGILLDSDSVVNDLREAESCDDDNGETWGSDDEKDIATLVQLFPNKREVKIRRAYRKCANDFRIALDWLLEEGSDTSDDETLSDPKESSDAVVEERGDSDDTSKLDQNPPSSSSFSFERYLETLKESYESTKGVSDQTQSNRQDDFSSGESAVIGERIDNSMTVPSGSVETIVDHCSVTDSASGNLRSSFHMTLDRFEQAINSVFSTLKLRSREEDEYFSCTVQDSTENELNSDKSSGLSATALNWDCVGDAAANSGESSDAPRAQRERFNKCGVPLKNTATNTNYKDFELLKMAQTCDQIPNKVLYGSLNFISCSVVNSKESSLRTTVMLDKGTSTEDIETGFAASGSDKESLLMSMFPTQSPSDLSSLLTNCMGDLNWAVGLLLDSGHEISHDFNPSEFADRVQSAEGVATPPVEEETSDVFASCTDEDSIEEENQQSEASTTLKNKKRSKVPVENINFIMSDNNISEHVRKIRNARLGIVDTEESIGKQADDWTTVYPGSSEEEMEEEEETLAVALNTDFVTALQAQFGSYIIPNIAPEKQVVIDLPVYLARQLHSCIMDSLSKQLEEEQRLINQMIAEDECLARQLQDIENGHDGVTKQKSIQEIMDEELALNIHKSLNKEKSNENTMAGKLSKQLLSERFPSMDSTALDSILKDTDHSLYQATQLLEAAGYQRATSSHDLTSIPEDVSSGGEMSSEEALEQANVYREAAKVFLQMRHNCFDKAQKAYLEGKKHVASYYSQMANWHNQKIEQANLLASTLLLSNNKKSTTLDLHFLRVCEAMQILDMFIDAHVNNLIEINLKKREVYIITGRGRHSHDGRSKIRPATLQRLRKRSISYQLLNPGLLLVVLTATTSLTYQN